VRARARARVRCAARTHRTARAPPCVPAACMRIPSSRGAHHAGAMGVLAALALVATSAPLAGRWLSFSAPVLAPRDQLEQEDKHSLLAGPDAVYHNEGMPPIRSGSLRPLSAVQLADGTIVQASITCFEGDHTPIWSHADVPSSTVAHRSTDGGKNWNYSATIGAAKDFPWSGEGFNEGGLAIAADGKTIVTASRTGAGDYEPASACLGYFDYHTSRSSDGGFTWSFPEPIVGAGSCSPNLLNIGNSLVLGGGRMCGNSTTDIFLWLDEAGMGDPNAFVPYSISYWYNALQTNASAPRFDELINSTCRDETSGMIQVKALTNTTGSVTFDLDINHSNPIYTMNFTLVPSDTGTEDSGRSTAMAELGSVPPPGSIPLGRDKADCISWHGAAVVPTTSNTSSTSVAALEAATSHHQAHNQVPATQGSGGGDRSQTQSPSAPHVPGCYVDVVSDRLLKHQVCLVTGGCAQLSHEWCGQQCQLAGFAVAGVEASHQCCCGHELPTSAVQAPASDCNESCTGDKSEDCGGRFRLWAFNASSVGPPSVPIPTISRVCGNWSTKSKHGTTTTCENLTAFPTDGAFAPIILVGENFSWADRSASSGGPTCRIDPYHGGSIFIAKGENANASATAINFVTFPATIHNDTYAECIPPPVLANGPGLLRLSVDNATWRGIAGEAGFPVEYFSLVDLAVGKRPYVNTDVGHLLMRTNCLAQGETIGHNLCQTSVTINATLRSVGKTWSWGSLIQGDRALPFNMSSLPPNVHNDLDVTIVFGARGRATGNYVIHRLVRFARVTTNSTQAAAQAVQVDAWTKTLSIGGNTFLGSGFYFGSYSPSDLLKMATELPSLVRRGVNMGVMLTLPGANETVQQSFFASAAHAGFKVIWPLFFTTALDANQTRVVRALSAEPALLGWYITDNGCSAHSSISLLAQGYDTLKALDPLHVTFGSVNCNSPWLFSDKPSVLPPGAKAALAVVLPAGTQPRTQLSLDVPLLQNYVAKLSGQTGTERHGCPFAPIGNCLSSSMTPSTFGTGLWLGAVLAEAYYSAGWEALPFANVSSWDTAIQNYSTALRKFEPHRLARFGNTRLSVALSPPENVSSLRARAWYDTDANAAYVVVVNVGEVQGVHFTATVKQLFNPRMVYRAVNDSVGASDVAVLRVPGCRVHYRPVQTSNGPWDNDVSTTPSNNVFSRHV
jgi:hypothetical protein